MSATELASEAPPSLRGPVFFAFPTECATTDCPKRPTSSQLLQMLEQEAETGDLLGVISPSEYREPSRSTSTSSGRGSLTAASASLGTPLAEDRSARPPEPNLFASVYRRSPSNDASPKRPSLGIPHTSGMAGGVRQKVALLEGLRDILRPLSKPKGETLQKGALWSSLSLHKLEARCKGTLKSESNGLLAARSYLPKGHPPARGAFKGCTTDTPHADAHKGSKPSTSYVTGAEQLQETVSSMVGLLRPPKNTEPSNVREAPASHLHKASAAETAEHPEELSMEYEEARTQSSSNPEAFSKPQKAPGKRASLKKELGCSSESGCSQTDSALADRHALAAALQQAQQRLFWAPHKVLRGSQVVAMVPSLGSASFPSSLHGQLPRKLSVQTEYNEKYRRSLLARSEDLGKSGSCPQRGRLCWTPTSQLSGERPQFKHKEFTPHRFCSRSCEDTRALTELLPDAPSMDFRAWRRTPPAVDTPRISRGWETREAMAVPERPLEARRRTCLHAGELLSSEASAEIDYKQRLLQEQQRLLLQHHQHVLNRQFRTNNVQRQKQTHLHREHRGSSFKAQDLWAYAATSRHCPKIAIPSVSWGSPKLQQHVASALAARSKESPPGVATSAITERDRGVQAQRELLEQRLQQRYSMPLGASAALKQLKQWFKQRSQTVSGAASHSREPQTPLSGGGNCCSCNPLGHPFLGDLEAPVRCNEGSTGSCKQEAQKQQGQGSAPLQGTRRPPPPRLNAALLTDRQEVVEQREQHPRQASGVIDGRDTIRIRHSSNLVDVFAARPSSADGLWSEPLAATAVTTAAAGCPARARQPSIPRVPLEPLAATRPVQHHLDSTAAEGAAAVLQTISPRARAGPEGGAEKTEAFMRLTSPSYSRDSCKVQSKDLVKHDKGKEKSTVASQQRQQQLQEDRQASTTKQSQTHQPRNGANPSADSSAVPTPAVTSTSSDSSSSTAASALRRNGAGATAVNAGPYIAVDAGGAQPANVATAEDAATDTTTFVAAIESLSIASLTCPLIVSPEEFAEDPGSFPKRTMAPEAVLSTMKASPGKKLDEASPQSLNSTEPGTRQCLPQKARAQFATTREVSPADSEFTFAAASSPAAAARPATAEGSSRATYSSICSNKTPEAGLNGNVTPPCCWWYPVSGNTRQQHHIRHCLMQTLSDTAAARAASRQEPAVVSTPGGLQIMAFKNLLSRAQQRQRQQLRRQQQESRPRALPCGDPEGPLFTTPFAVTERMKGPTAKEGLQRRAPGTRVLQSVALKRPPPPPGLLLPLLERSNFLPTRRNPAS
ncbi:hypothetical protein cyc_04220 [Cyclospora cayetanensis]|uniref:Uncharacterized protein n=1 Tax=Cyclospora cayetanensis TaxID=88456 RepID=A0A1D3CY76_9EIME|nr:hypothetical protein cyc_04220 [Cyclospora cayetanensis]